MKSPKSANHHTSPAGSLSIAPCVILTRSVTDVITAGSVLHGDTDFEEILRKKALLRVAENCLKCKHIYTWRYTEKHKEM